MLLYQISANHTQNNVFSMVYNGSYLYAVSNDDYNVQAYVLDNNLLSAIPGATIDLGTGNTSWHIYADNDYLFVPTLNGKLSAYSFDGSTFTMEGTVAKTAPATEMRGCWGDSEYIYFGTDTYFAAYTFNGSTFTYVTSSHTPTAVGFVDHIQSDRDVMHLSDRGKIFVVGSEGFGIYTIEGNKFRCLSRSGKKSGVAPERVSIDEYISNDAGKKYIYVSYSTAGIKAYRWNGTSAISVASFDDFTGSEFPDAILGDGHGVWVAGSDLKIRYYTFDGTTFNRVYTNTTGAQHGYNLIKINKIIYLATSNGIQIWTFDTSQYVDFDEIATGRGTSSSPLNSSQFTRYNAGGPTISAGVSAIAGDNIYLKGENVTIFGTEYISKLGGYNYLPWEDGAPYKLSETDSNGFINIGIWPQLISAIGPIHHNIKYENAVFKKLQFHGAVSTSSPSGTYILNNNIFYDYFGATSLNQWYINVNGCTFLSASCSFAEMNYWLPGAPEDNEIYFNDSIFIKSTFTDLKYVYGIIQFNYCLFTNSITQVSAHLSSTYGGGGTVDFNHCTFNWTPTRSYPIFNDFSIDSIDSNLYSSAYDIPNTSLIRSSAWETSGYSTGFWNSNRTGPGAFYFIEEATPPVSSASYYYIDFDTGSSGDGTEGLPFNSDQFYDYIYLGKHHPHSLSASVSANNGDTFYLKGTNVTLNGLDYVARRGGYNYLSWLDGSPYKLSSYAPSFSTFVIFGLNNGFEYYNGPASSATIYNIKVENAIISDYACNESIDSSAPSGTFKFNNDIFYNGWYANKIKQWDVYLNGCTLLSADCYFSEYTGDVATCACNNKAYFNDTIFVDSIISDTGFNYGIFQFNYCLFTKSITEVSARMSSTYDKGGTVEFNNCTFNWIPNKNFVSWDDVTLSIYDSSLISDNYGIPNTITERQSVWNTDGFSAGFWNTHRTGPGAFNFISEGKGHIGAFYFGPINANIYVIPINITGNIVNPNIIIIDTINTIVYPDVVNAFLTVNQPQVYSFANIAVDFVGIPRTGSSPLMIDFVATVRATGSYSGKYKVLEYRWYFDYGRDTNTYESSTSPNITHTFTGYVGETYDIKTCAIIQLL